MRPWRPQAKGIRRRNEILRYLEGFDRQQWPCSVREIGAAVGLSSPSSVLEHLRVLERQGFVEQGKGRKGWRAA